jgi:hypothetical protein
MFKADVVGPVFNLRLFNQPLNNWTIREMFQYNQAIGSPYQQDLSSGILIILDYLLSDTRIYSKHSVDFLRKEYPHKLLQLTINATKLLV